jgi:formate dehydrogenase major subunit
VPGLGARLGRGAATTTQESLAASDCIVIMGANMAENHPVGFRFVMQAKERGATVVHVDPRFSRTSALADLPVPLRAGSDLVFLGALVNYVISEEKFFREYVVHYTNAPVIVDPAFRDTEDVGGLFSGYDPQKRSYDQSSWQYAGQREHPTSSQGEANDASGAQTAEPRSQLAGHLEAPPQTDPTLQHPRCVFQLVKRHFARYTPELVEQSCGVPRATFLKVAEAITRNSGIGSDGVDRTTAFCYAVAWTQHTVGTQIISCCALLQLLLGNVGRPGGGILALRGHATIQGSTDIPTLYNLLPGYLPMPASDPGGEPDLPSYLKKHVPRTGAWHRMPAYLVSLLKAWYGAAATPENDFAFDLVPKIEGDYSFQRMVLLMRDGVMRGLFCMGQNPAVGGQNAVLTRRALANLDWLVVRDIHEVETAAFWYDAPEVRSGEVSPKDIKTEIFLMPASVSAEKEGSLTNTQRLIQWHDKAIDPPGDSRSEASFMVLLGRRLKALYAGDTTALGRQINALAWDYATHGPHDEPDLDAVVKEINGYTVADGKLVPDYFALEDDGSTAAGCWLYSGIYPAEGQNLARRRTRGAAESPCGVAASPEWGFSWPANRRIMYNRASARPDGRPWSERKQWVWWDAQQGRWTGHDLPDFPATKPPDYRPPPGATGLDAHDGASPFVNMADGKGWLFAASGLKDGPLPTHYEPRETPVENALYPEMPFSPVVVELPHADNPYHEVGDPRFPHVITTYRLTEHHTGGGMSRWVPWLAELQPQGFVELSPELAAEIGVDNGDWVVLSTLRGRAEARALVTDRLQPLTVAGKTLHQVGMPWHFGFGGIAQGGIANDLSALVEDPNSRIHEAKSFTCALRKGRLA